MIYWCIIYIEKVCSLVVVVHATGIIFLLFFSLLSGRAHETFSNHISLFFTSVAACSM